MKRFLLVVLLLGLVAGCRQQPDASAPAGEAAPPAPRRAAQEAAQSAARVAEEASTAAEAEAAVAAEAKEMLSAHKKKREILVGGCARRCRAPLDGFRGFARALWRIPDPDAAQPVLRFVDTSELVDGEAIGRSWADLFLEGRLLERQEGIEVWRDEFVAEMGEISDAAALQAVLDGPLEMTRRSADVVVIHFALPATDKGDGGEIWHFTFGKRGLEWLLRGVERP
jgi:hypothetical protein